MKKTPRIIKYIFPILAAVLLMQFSGCSVFPPNKYDSEFYAGEKISPEDMESIAEDFYAGMTEKYSPETDADGEYTVYWVSGGKVWHYSRNCSSISSSSDVRSGRIADTLSDGKVRPCSRCSPESEKNEYEQQTSN